MRHRVAGHDNFCTLGSTLAKTTTTKEADFYHNLENYPQYKEYTVECYNIKDKQEIDSNKQEKQEINKKDKVIFLENLIYRMEKPAIMDIKLGVKNYRDDADINRIAKNIIKTHISTSAKLGLRIAGYQYWDNETLIKKDKHNCREFNQQRLTHTLHNFLPAGLLAIVKGNIEQILNSLTQHHTFRLYGSSLLIIYDTKNPIETLEVRLIDFSNYYKLKDPNDQDDGFIFGLTNLYNLF